MTNSYRSSTLEGMAVLTERAPSNLTRTLRKSVAVGRNL